ncbi:hypothetical protein DXG01_009442 [Tephrocybe rancida]|nr:hypothetical protein DXG01_009442 [Tephrocybe rancida]
MQRVRTRRRQRVIVDVSDSDDPPPPYEVPTPAADHSDWRNWTPFTSSRSDEENAESNAQHAARSVTPPVESAPAPVLVPAPAPAPALPPGPAPAQTLLTPPAGPADLPRPREVVVVHSRRGPSRSYYIGPIPPPDTLAEPDSCIGVRGYYLVSVGQKVGIFFNWYVTLPSAPIRLLNNARNTANSLVVGVYGGAQQEYPSWVKALEAYRHLYRTGLLRALIIVDGPFSKTVELDPEEDLAEYAAGLSLNPENDLM